MSLGFLSAYLGRRRILSNPYYNSAALLSRLIVNTATMIWALLVLFLQDALKINYRAELLYGPMLNVMSEDYWAIGAFAFSAFGLARLMLHKHPSWIGSIGYGAQAVFWLFLCYALWFVLGAHQLLPASASAVTVIAVISLYAFMTNPRLPYDSPPR